MFAFEPGGKAYMLKGAPIGQGGWLHMWYQAIPLDIGSVTRTQVEVRAAIAPNIGGDAIRHCDPKVHHLEPGVIRNTQAPPDT